MRVLLIAGMILACGCGKTENQQSAPTNTGGGYGGYGDYGYGTTVGEFHHDVKSNATPEKSLTDLKFTDIDGKEVPLNSHIGGKNLVLVMTRGYHQQICPFCSAQVGRLANRYAQIQAKNAEVVVVYPVATASDKGQLNNLISTAKKELDHADAEIPFPMLFDVELSAVDHLGIRHELSKPATYILDTSGKVRFAYVGQDLADRPSVKAILKQLDSLPQDKKEKPPEKTAG